MPASPSPEQFPILEPEHAVRPRRAAFGPVFGIVIILALLVFGAFYSWNARLNKRNDQTQAATYIPAGTTTLPDITK